MLLGYHRDYELTKEIDSEPFCQALTPKIVITYFPTSKVRFLGHLRSVITSEVQKILDSNFTISNAMYTEKNNLGIKLSVNVVT